MNVKNCLLSLMTLLTAVSFSSCNSDGPDDPNIGRPFFTDIVTVDAITPKSTIFSFRKIDDSPLVKLTLNQVANSNEVKVGDRLAIQYYSAANKQYVDSEITLLAIAPTEGNGKPIPSGSATENGNWYTSAIYYPVLQRSGEYLNIQFQAPVIVGSAKLKLVIDENTLNDTYPVAYLMFDGSYSQSSSQYVFFMSYSLEELWNDPNVAGLNVIYKTDAGEKNYKLDRPTMGEIKPVE